jgi:hypothetical protein
VPIPVQVIAYSITSAGGSEANDPKSWVLQGSNDGETWTTIQSRTSETFALRYLKQIYTLSTSATYTYFRLQINGLYDSNITEAKIAEWELYGTSISNYDITSNQGGILTAQYQGNTNETYMRLIDKSRSGKYCVSEQKTTWVKYHSPHAARFLSYSLTAANDAPERDPKSWILYASNDDTNWTEIDRRTNEVFPFRYATQFYLCATEEKYTWFKLEITENSGANTVQLAEWQLFGTEETGIHISQQTDPLVIYPNPAVDYITLLAPVKARLSVFDTQGRCIDKREVEQGTVIVPVSEYKPGVYLVRLQSGDWTKVALFLKNN